MKWKPLSLFCLVLAFSSAYSDPRSFSFFSPEARSLPKDDQPVYSKNPEANALYIQGLDYLSKGRSSAGGSLLNARTALKLFRQATQKDPQFALAYIGQANALDQFTFSVPGGTSPVKIFREQEAAARKAAELDDSLTQAHQVLAELYRDNVYDWPKAEKELKRVIELTPNAVEAYTRYGLFLGMMGRFEEAEAQVKLAQALDENNVAPNRAMLLILYWQHKDDAALVQGLEALRKKESRPTHFYMGLIYIHQGQFQKGIQEMKLASFGDADSLAGLAYAYAKAGDKAELDNTLEQFKRHPAHNHVFYGLAQVYVALGNKDRAMSLIEKDYLQRSSRLNTLMVDPVMDPLRQEPRFKELMRKMNFEQ